MNITSVFAKPDVNPGANLDDFEKAPSVAAYRVVVKEIGKTGATCLPKLRKLTGFSELKTEM